MAKTTFDDQLNEKLQQVKIIKYSSSNIEVDIENYMDAKKSGDVSADLSLNDYIKQTKYPDEPNAIVVTDLRNERFERDLKGVDFSGCLMSGAEFYGCDMTGVNLRDTDLRNVWFDDTKLTNVDFRGADLTNCGFSSSYQDWTDPSKPESKGLQGLKFSTTQKMEREHLYENQFIDEKLKVEREVFNKQKEADIKAKKAEMSTEYGYTGYFLGASEKYKTLESELKVIENRTFNKKPDYTLHPSLINVMGFERNLDPVYVRGTFAKELLTERQYVPISKDDIIKYLERVKTEPKLSLNDFAKERAQAGDLHHQKEYKREIKIDPSKQIIADCGSVKDLNGLDFSNTNLREACFAGANLQGCKFDNADISRASFEGANVKGASFVGTEAKETNFFASQLEQAQISGSNFTKAFMSHSKAEDAKITGANFDYANIKNGKWEGVHIVDSKLNGADLEGISLVGAYIKGVSAQHAILTNAHIERSTVIASQFQNSLMDGISASYAGFKDTILENVKAPFANLEHVKFDELTKLDGADLENAILDYIQAEKVSFKQANLNGIRAKEANLTEATLEMATLQFADLEGAILKGAKASNVDMTGCNLQKVEAKGVILTDAVMKDINAKGADLKEAICVGADFRGADLRGAILREVDARKAKLQHVKTDEKTVADEMSVEGAKVNAATEELKGAKGVVISENSKGEEVQKDIEEHNIEAIAIKKEMSATAIGKLGAKVLGMFGTAAQKASEYIEQPFSTRTGRIIGAIAGVAIGAAIVTSVVLTAGLSIPVMIGVASACIGVCAATGAIAGHFGAKKVGAVGLAGGVAGATMGPMGVAAGLAAGVAVDQGVKMVFGKTGSEILGDGVKGFGDIAVKAKEGLEGGGELGEKLLEEQKQLDSQYKKAEKQKGKGASVSAVDFKMQNELAANVGIDGSLLIDKKKKEEVIGSPEAIKKSTGKKVTFAPEVGNRGLEEGEHVKKLKEERGRAGKAPKKSASIN